MRGSQWGTPTVMKCPSCGHEQPGGEAECRSCQVIFEKLAQREARRELGMAYSGSSEPAAAVAIESVGLIHEAQFAPADQSALDEAAAAGAIVGSFTLIAILAEAAGWIDVGLGLFALIDVALAFGLAYGTHRGSRVAACSLLIYFVASKLAQYAAHPPSITGIWLPLLLASAMGKGALASFNRR
ncbi:MAG: hypothetical protein HY553_03595 [Elusimicrobia bacterium]|nr:hypothetical protein [Elusimicrobiota bacterium]